MKRKPGDSRIPRYARDQKQYLTNIRNDMIRPAKLAGEEYLLLQTELLEWLVNVAWHAPRKGKKGKPPINRFQLEMRHEEDRPKFFELKAALRKTTDRKERERIEEAIFTLVRNFAADFELTDDYVRDDLLPRTKLRRPRKQGKEKKAASAE